MYIMTKWTMKLNINKGMYNVLSLGRLLDIY